MRRIWWGAWVLLLVGSAAGVGSAEPERGGPEGAGSSKRLQAAPLGRDQREDVQDRGTDSSQEAERFRRLKEKDPEAFRHAMHERRATLRQRLAHLKETNPEAFERVKQRLKEHRRERLEQLRKTDPERFQQVMEERRAKLQQRLEGLKATDPQRYEALMARREQWRERKLEQFKRERPEAYERFMERHPQWRERPQERHEAFHERAKQADERFHEGARERGEDRRDYREGARDRREDRWDRREDARDLRHDSSGEPRELPPASGPDAPGVRDRGEGLGRGAGEGGIQRNPEPAGQPRDISGKPQGGVRGSGGSSPGDDGQLGRWRRGGRSISGR